VGRTTPIQNLDWLCHATGPTPVRSAGREEPSESFRESIAIWLILLSLRNHPEKLTVEFLEAVSQHRPIDLDENPLVEMDT